MAWRWRVAGRDSRYEAEPLERWRLRRRRKWCRAGGAPALRAIPLVEVAKPEAGVGSEASVHCDCHVGGGAVALALAVNVGGGGGGGVGGSRSVG